MKRSIGIALVALVLLLTGYAGYRYLSELALVRASDRTATKLSDIPESWQSENLESHFRGFSGSFVLYRSSSHQYEIYNEEQSQRRVSPVSTFKIANSLIGLETGVVHDENTRFQWDGTKYAIAAWNRDQTLASAFNDSVVWYYQELAARVGEAQMQHYLEAIGYGNQNSSGGLTKFWLDSSLRISPLEQVLFLRRLYAYDLPFSHANIDIVKKIMVRSSDGGVVLSGKSGFAGSHLSWFVGYVERENDVFFFATKVEGKGVQNSAARSITEEILREKHLL